MTQAKTYTLLSNKPLNGFDNSIVDFLNSISDMTPRTAVIVALYDDADAVGIYTYNTEHADLLQMKGHLEEEIMHDFILANLPHYVTVAEQHDLMPRYLTETEEDDDQDYDEEADEL